MRTETSIIISLSFDTIVEDTIVDDRDDLLSNSSDCPGLTSSEEV